jgi:hypothetical protein
LEKAVTARPGADGIRGNGTKRQRRLGTQNGFWDRDAEQGSMPVGDTMEQDFGGNQTVAGFDCDQERDWIFACCAQCENRGTDEEPIGLFARRVNAARNLTV